MKDEENNKKNIWVTSDPHLGHGNIMKYCGRTQFMTPEDKEKFLEVKDDEGDAFRNLKMSRKSVENMDDGIIENINAVVMPEDQFWIMGDFAWGRKASDFYDYRQRINCKDVRLIWGNHDDRYYLKYISELDPAGYLFQGYYESGTFVQTENGLLSEDEIAEEYAITGQKKSYKRNQRWYFNHYMNAVWNGSHKGVYHLYGHSHQGAEQWREQHMPYACAIDIGVDGNDFKPHLLDDLKKKFDDKRAKCKAHAIDHHKEKIKIVRDKSGSH